MRANAAFTHLRKQTPTNLVIFMQGTVLYAMNCENVKTLIYIYLSILCKQNQNTFNIIGTNANMFLNILL